MKQKLKTVTVGLFGSLILIVACSGEKDYGKNFERANDAPVGFYDMAKYEKGVFTAIGWSADKEDGAPLKRVLIYVDGKAAGEAKFIHDRPDVVNVFKNDRWLKSGWQLSAEIPLDKGVHSSMALSYDSKEALRVYMKDFTVE
jgi:hypothetical protein